MVTAIVICLIVAVFFVLKGWLVGRSATSDGDYSFAVWWGLAIILVLVAVFLTALILL